MSEDTAQTAPPGGVLVRRTLPSDVAADTRAHLAAWQIAFRGTLSNVLLDGLRIADFEPAWRRFVVAENGASRTSERHGEQCREIRLTSEL